MLIKRYCGHLENIPVPETKEKFLMERGRQCRKCRFEKNSIMRTVIDQDKYLPRAMASAMDTYRE